MTEKRDLKFKVTVTVDTPGGLADGDLRSLKDDVEKRVRGRLYELSSPPGTTVAPHVHVTQDD